MEVFNKSELKKLYKPPSDSSGEQNGQITIVGGSRLFHGAPLLALKTASRIVDMVFFATPEKSLKFVVSRLKADLFSFIWVPWEEVEEYIEKSDAVLIGPGMMRYSHEGKRQEAKGESLDGEGEKTRKITKRLLGKFPDKKWVSDPGSLQVIDAEFLPKGAVITPNKKEFSMLFERIDTPGALLVDSPEVEVVSEMAKKYNCTIVAKDAETIVCSPGKCTKVIGGNAGLTKGGAGDVHAGLTVALLAKNDPFLAASSASYIVKVTADELYKEVGANYNADDLAEKIPTVFFELVK